MSNYILFDAPPSTSFVKTIESVSKLQWRVSYCDGRTSVARWRRILNYFVFPLWFVFSHYKIDYVIAWQQFFGIMPAFINRIIPIHNGMNITIMTFIYKPKSGIMGGLYKWFVNTALTGKTVKHIIVFSKSEIDYYSKLFPKAGSKFSFVPLGIDKDNIPEVIQGNHIFTAGMSNRDYTFLCEAIAGSEYNLRIACPGVVIPPDCNNIEVLSDCHGTDMLKELSSCKVVVIALKDRNISSGQLMLLHAMQAGKPVIITYSDALTPYIEHGKTAFFINNDKTELMSYLKLLYNDSAQYKSMAEEAARKVSEEFSIHALGCNIARLTFM